MKSGVPPLDTAEMSATKRGDDNMMGGGNFHSMRSPSNKKSQREEEVEVIEVKDREETAHFQEPGNSDINMKE